MPSTSVVIAEAGLGKTHIGLTFPGPVVVLDTEFRADEVLRKFRNVEKYWKKVESWSDIREAAARFRRDVLGKRRAANRELRPFLRRVIANARRETADCPTLNRVALD